jgi:hypothetical protein
MMSNHEELLKWLDKGERPGITIDRRAAAAIRELVAERDALLKRENVWLDDAKYWRAEADKVNGENFALKAENERLRKALSC